ncbi:MAG TPA: cytidine deaminase [Chloroflexi bacterium]|jgi:cytidine deaminase|nr:cytidine deaminase [Chloroflexota bacterium]
MTRPETLRREDLSPEWRALLAASLEARDHAYAPYSNFAVGAAVRTDSGRIFAGCNIENASFGLTVCAERVAIFKAVCQGESRIVAMAVSTEGGATPCGACRQVMAEFAADMPVLLSDVSGHLRMTSLRDLLPDAFSSLELSQETDSTARKEVSS